MAPGMAAGSLDSMYFVSVVVGSHGADEVDERVVDDDVGLDSAKALGTAAAAVVDDVDVDVDSDIGM